MPSILAGHIAKKHLMEKVTMLRTHSCGATVSALGTPKNVRRGGNRRGASADVRQVLIMLSQVLLRDGWS